MYVLKKCNFAWINTDRIEESYIYWCVCVHVVCHTRGDVACECVIRVYKFRCPCVSVGLLFFELVCTDTRFARVCMLFAGLVFLIPTWTLAPLVCNLFVHTVASIVCVYVICLYKHSFRSCVYVCVCGFILFV